MADIIRNPTQEGWYWGWDNHDLYLVFISPQLLVSGKTRMVASPSVVIVDDLYFELDDFVVYVGPLIKPEPPTKDAE